MKIALTFSGGGYRASAFSLGTLTYLDKVKINEESLLSKVTTLSTISGGTITGAKYAIGIKKGESLKEIYAFLYKFFLEVDLITESIELLNTPINWQGERIKSLINAFADIYDKHLFKKDKFGILLNDENPIHLKHISFNAIEFTHGIQFRFQVSEKGLIGNKDYSIPKNDAKEIRMADILAASSCFPGGFEPINFPRDFSLPMAVKEKFSNIGLMDGGIGDNQGIEPILLAEKRNNSDIKDKNLDLIIVSDVSSPYMEKYTGSVKDKENWWRRRTMQEIRIGALIIFFLSIALLAYLFIPSKCIHPKISIIIAILSTLFLTTSIIGLIVIRFVIKKIKNNGFIDSAKLKKLLHIRFGVFQILLENRIKSVLKLVGSIFMKRIRSLNYYKIYENDLWENRRIMSGIYELSNNEKEVKKIKDKIKNGKISFSLEPSPKIQATSARAYSMETTLWFDEKHKESRDSKETMLDTIIACGQYTTCWNLLEYIEYTKDSDKKNMNENHNFLLNCEQQLREDWENFNKDPYWFVKKYNNGNV